MSKAADAKPAANTAAEAMTYKVEHFPNSAQRRALLAQEAETLPLAELKARAAGAHIDISGATNKADVVEAVKTGARGASA